MPLDLVDGTRELSVTPTAGSGGDPQAQQCGWLEGRYGASWQAVPTALADMLRHPDAAKPQRVMQALLRMKKLDIAALRRAYGG